jgi:hypothetical protein
MAKFRRKPREVEAGQACEDPPPEGVRTEEAFGLIMRFNDRSFTPVRPTDWIIRHGNDRIEIMGDARFRAEYEEVKE